jgi:mRNA-degrading endonuclease RelE of RelBE toxin-antitoxin system
MTSTPPHRVRLAPRAQRDLRHLERPTVKRVQNALRALAAGADNLDVRAITGQPGWRRLRVGEHRVLFREVPGGYLVARVIDRRDLRRAVESL